MTLKQIEAFYWVAMLGSFSAAAARLNIAQSTISKRIQELESVLGLDLFERDTGAGHMTRKGRELLPLIEETLRMRDKIESAAGTAQSFTGRFRLGITELVALAWLSELVAAIRAAFPNVELEPHVDSVGNLYDKLADRSLDLVIGPRIAREERFTVVPLAVIEQAWVCSPQFYRDSAPMPVKQLEMYPLLLQPPHSGLQVMLKRFLDAHGVRPKNIITCNGMVALVELAAAGLGMTCVPKFFFAQSVAASRLRIVKTDPAVPGLEFAASYRDDTIGSISAAIAGMAQEVCLPSHVARRKSDPGPRTRTG